MEGRGELTWCGQCQAVELWPENIPSVLFYLSCETQWRYAGMSNVPTGLDYAGVRAVMALPQGRRVILVGIALSSLLELRKIRVGNFLPALALAPLIVALLAWIQK